MNIKLQRIIKVIVFSILFCLIFFYASAVLLPKKGASNNLSRILTFYGQPKNSIDVLFVGASTYLRGISPLTIWEDYGITSYIRGSTAQHPAVTYYYLVESLKYQHPKLVILDGKILFNPYNVDKNEGSLRTSIDAMNLSIDKIKLSYDIVSRSETQTLTSYIFPLFRYHSRWKQVKQFDFEYYLIDFYDHFKGALMDYRSVPIQIQESFMRPTKMPSKYDDTSLYYFKKIFQLCKENNITVMFVTTPRFDWRYSYYLGIKQLADQYNFLYIDYNLPDYYDDLKIDPSTDYYDKGHLNVFGAQKVSKHLGAFLQENFNLPDKRKDPDYEQWNIDLQFFKDQLNQETIK